jgi:diaminopimelate epimerase
MTSPFIKMQGLGNKFVIAQGPIKLTSDEIIQYCKEYDDDGADGLLVVNPINNQTVGMKYWNADGLAAEMCGNGLRCVTRFAIDNKMVKPGTFDVKTDAGQLQVIWDGVDSNKVEVQVGKVVLDQGTIVLHGHEFYEGSVGNPHAVTFVENIDQAPVKDVGPKVENDSYFPNKTNVEFVQVISPDNIRVRTWERGCGETSACGTGMVASAAAAVKFKGAHYPLTVKVRGGSAKVWLDDEQYTRMVGPAEIV